MCVKHSNLAIFVPHIGCPNQCSFCNQNSISGAVSAPTGADVHTLCRETLAVMGERAKHTEVAFFGGSFTAIEQDYMTALLEAASCYVGEGKFAGIRISTRPDAIDEAVLATLKRYGVTAIELGAQSMNDAVLAANLRGHSAADVRRAAQQIKAGVFSLGLQMMVGLYGSTAETDRETAKALGALKPDTMRIYPTVIIKNTLLEQLYQRGEYSPMTLADGVSLCAELLTFFEEQHIKVIRMGLHASDTLEQDYVGGLYHPAFRELCENQIMLGKILAQIEQQNIVSPAGLLIEVNPSDVSKVMGQNRCNAKHLYSLGYDIKLKQNKERQKNTIQLETLA